MNKKIMIIWAIWVVCMMFLGERSEVWGADDQPGREGWIRLFDGRTLQGWRASENPDTFKIREGMIVADGPRSHLFYVGPVQNHDFENFELKLDVMTQPKANSGVYVHTQFQEEGYPKAGYEIQINNSYAGTGKYRELKRTGSLYGVRNIFKSPVRDKQWFTLFIRVRGRRIQVRLNEQEVVDYLEPDNVLQKKDRAGRILSRGTIALQGHDPGSKVFFKNIFLRPLASGRPKDARSRDEIEFQNRITSYYSENLPIIDFHVHLKGGLTVPQALRNSRETGIFYGIAENCGLDFQVKDDDSLRAYLKKMEGLPTLIGMQAEGREWLTLFSPEMIARFDYVFTDAMTYTDQRGKRVHLWRPNEVQIDNPQKFMDRLVETIVSILENEPIDIYVNPTFLPAQIAGDYNLLWTHQRMDRVIEAAIHHDVAIEINARYRLPSLAFIQRAKKAGAKFSFGTNNGGPDLGRLEYCLEAIDRCGLIKKDIFVPDPNREKKVLRWARQRKRKSEI